MPIHSTLADEAGNVYKIVQGWWLKTLTVLAIGNFVIAVILAALMLDNMQDMQSQMQLSQKFIQRSKAMDEMLVNRAKIGQWVYTTVCDNQKAQNKGCYDNPLWWADPSRYPLIANDPSGTGLFPKQPPT